MSNFAAIFKHELRRMRRDRALPWLVFLFALVSAYAAWNGASWAAERHEAARLAQQELAESREDYHRKTLVAIQRMPGYPAATNVPLGFPYRAVLPVADLAPLAIGQSEGYPQEARFYALTNAARLFVSLEANIDNPAALAAGHFDLAFAIVFLLPLFLLAATFDLWTQERELGTADIVLSQPVQPAMLLAAKALVRGAMVLIALTAVLLGALWLTAGEGGSGGGTLLETAAIMVLYGAFWIGIAVSVNVFARNSASAALTCAAAWISLVILVPALLAAAQDVARPAPSRAQFANDLRLLEQALRTHAQQQREAMRATSSRATQPGLRSGMLLALDRVQSEDAQYNALIERFATQEHARRQFGQKLRVLSPAVVTQDALERMAGTDADRALVFQAQVRAFQQAVRWLGENPPAEAAALAVDEYLRRLPEFTFDEPSSSRAAALIANAAALLGGILILLAAVVWRLRRRGLHNVHSGETR